MDEKEYLYLMKLVRFDFAEFLRKNKIKTGRDLTKVKQKLKKHLGPYFRRIIDLRESPDQLISDDDFWAAFWGRKECDKDIRMRIISIEEFSSPRETDFHLTNQCIFVSPECERGGFYNTANLSPQYIFIYCGGDNWQVFEGLNGEIFYSDEW